LSPSSSFCKQNSTSDDRTERRAAKGSPSSDPTGVDRAKVVSNCVSLVSCGAASDTSTRVETCTAKTRREFQAQEKEVYKRRNFGKLKLVALGIIVVQLLNKDGFNAD
jgi:hypothetical protein